MSLLPNRMAAASPTHSKRWWCGVDVGILYVYNRPVGKPQEKVMMSTSASHLSIVKPRFIEPVGERTKLPKVDTR
jgi:hypothetical protein